MDFGDLNSNRWFDEDTPAQPLFDEDLQELTGPAAYTLNAETGSYAISGVAATLRAARQINAATGAYAISGLPTTLLHGYTLVASPGSYALTGFPATLLAARVLVAAAGGYTISGLAASTLAGRVLAALAGSYDVTGRDADLVYVPLARQEATGGWIHPRRWPLRPAGDNLPPTPPVPTEVYPIPEGVPEPVEARKPSKRPPRKVLRRRRKPDELEVPVVRLHPLKVSAKADYHAADEALFAWQQKRREEEMIVLAAVALLDEE